MRNRHAPWFRTPAPPLVDPAAVEQLTTPTRFYRAKDGRPISMLEWLLLSRVTPEQQQALKEKRWFGYHLSYKVLARTEVGPDMFVSTVWLGIDHSLFGGTPILFETMDFPSNRHCERATTEEEALFNHEAVVASFRTAGSYLLTAVRE